MMFQILVWCCWWDLLSKKKVLNELVYYYGESSSGVSVLCILLSSNISRKEGDTSDMSRPLMVVTDHGQIHCIACTYHMYLPVSTCVDMWGFGSTRFV